MASVPGRRGIGRAGGCAASVAHRRLLHARSDGAGCAGADRTRLQPSRPARRLPVSGNAAVFAARSAREGDRAARRGARRHGCLRALRRALGRRPKEAGTAEPLRRTPRQSPRSSRARRRPSRRAVHHSAFRRRAVPRSIARRRPLPQTSTSTRRARTGGCRITTGSTLADVFRQALEVAGPDRLLFGTDSSFFPRGWNRAVYDAQVSALDAAGVDEKSATEFSPTISTGYFPPKAALTGPFWCYDRVNSQGERHALRTGVYGRPIGADEHHPRHPKAVAPEACRARRRLRRRRLPADPAALGVRPRDAEIQPRLDHRVPRRDGDDFRRAGRLLLRAAAVAPRHRRTGRALPGRVRAVARDRHPERARSGKRILIAFACACTPPG